MCTKDSNPQPSHSAVAVKSVACFGAQLRLLFAPFSSGWVRKVKNKALCHLRLVGVEAVKMVQWCPMMWKWCPNAVLSWDANVVNWMGIECPSFSLLCHELVRARVPSCALCLDAFVTPYGRYQFLSPLYPTLVPRRSLDQIVCGFEGLSLFQLLQLSFVWVLSRFTLWIHVLWRCI